MISLNSLFDSWVRHLSFLLLNCFFILLVLIFFISHLMCVIILIVLILILSWGDVWVEDGRSCSWFGSLIVTLREVNKRNLKFNHLKTKLDPNKLVGTKGKIKHYRNSRNRFRLKPSEQLDELDGHDGTHHEWWDTRGIQVHGDVGVLGIALLKVADLSSGSDSGASVLPTWASCAAWPHGRACCSKHNWLFGLEGELPQGRGGKRWQQSRIHTATSACIF